MACCISRYQRYLNLKEEGKTHSEIIKILNDEGY